MRPFACLVFVVVCLTSTEVWGQTATPPAAAPPTSVGTAVDTFMTSMYPRLRRFLIATAEMMPEDGYQLRPSPDARSFAEALAHIGVSNLVQCRATAGTPLPPDHIAALRQTLTTKAALTALIRDSLTSCDPHFAPGGTDRVAQTRAGVSVHSWEMYGTLAVYLRMKGLVPPSTEEERKARGGEPDPGD